MMERIPYAILILLLLCVARPGHAQDADDDIEPELFRVRLFEITGEITKPQNIFGDRMNEDGLGLGAAYLWQTKPEGPTFIGLDFQWSPFFKVATDFVDVIDGFSTNLRETTRTTLWSSHVLTRFFPFNNFPVIDPFIEGLIGAKLMMTNTNISITETAENIDFIIESSKASFSYGCAAGFQVHLHKYQYYLTAKGTYLRGSSNGFYAIPEDLAGQSNLTIGDLDFLNAPIDILRIQLGLSISF